MEKKSVIDQIELCSDGTVRIRIGLLIIENGKTISCRWHRTTFDGSISHDQQMIVVNGHLAMMDEKPISESEIERIGKAIDFHNETKV